MPVRDQAVFDPVGTSYHTFRIPALLPVPTVDPGAQPPVLLAFCEGRVESAADSGLIELVLRRSLDLGRSWLPLQVVCRVEEMTCGNPAPVFDPRSGDIVLLSVRNGARVDMAALNAGTVDPQETRRVFVQRSPDLGASWTEPIDITESVKQPGWSWYATGPCHGITLRHGQHAGRLVIPANHTRTPAGDRTRSSGGHCIISDDGGRSWQIGFTDDNEDNRINANETSVAELSDGRLIFNARNHRGTGTPRVQATSPTGGRTLAAPYRDCPGISAPNIQGSLLSPDGAQLLLSTPADPTVRRDLTSYHSDDGIRWRRGAVINPGPSGYSDLGSLGDERIGVLYEAGQEHPYQQIRFGVRSLTELIASSDGAATASRS